MGAGAGAAAGAAAGYLFTGACTVGTSGLCAAGAPVIVPFFAAGGAAIGGLAGEISDAAEALAPVMQRKWVGLISLVGGLLGGDVKAGATPLRDIIKSEQEAQRRAREQERDREARNKEKKRGDGNPPDDPPAL